MSKGECQQRSVVPLVVRCLIEADSYCIDVLAPGGAACKGLAQCGSRSLYEQVRQCVRDRARESRELAAMIQEAAGAIRRYVRA